MNTTAKSMTMAATSSKSPPDQRMFLLASAQWQDSLLQSYRILHVTIQGFLMTTGAAVLAVQLTSAMQKNDAHPIQTAVFSTIFSFLIGILFWIQRDTAIELGRVVNSRAEDVNHWHRLIILCENDLAPRQRSFTIFKRWQQLHRVDLDEVENEYSADFIATPEYASKLIAKGLGHTRQVLDKNLFVRIQRLWIVLIIASVGISLWFTGVAVYTARMR